MIKERTSPHHVRRRLIKNKSLNIESVGKVDLETLSDVIDTPEGRGTVLRIIMGATRKMPVRALSYVDTAFRIASVLPHEQLQIIHANHLGEAINGINVKTSSHQSKTLAALTRMHLVGSFPHLKETTIHAQDTPAIMSPVISLSDTAQAAIDGNSKINSKLQAQGAKHGGNPIIYGAAHSVFQDTDKLELQSLMSDSPEQVRAERIVSIGCQMERTFYAARMAIRQIVDSVDLVDTAQLFTTHTVPPYFTARGGEQTLDHALKNGVNIDLCVDRSARRDIERLIQQITGE